MPNTPEQIELDKKLAASEEIRRLYRALAVFQSNAITRVLATPGDAEAIIAQAKNEFIRIKNAEEDLLKTSDKCKPGEVWDAKLQRCVLL